MSKTGLSLKMMRENQKRFPELHPGVGMFFANVPTSNGDMMWINTLW